tara:strand:- start:256 stop:696 length:441 start_codon:yes stop_codon:yes gene_type:complete
MTAVETQAQTDITGRTRYIGIKTPVQFSDGDGLFAMHTDVVKNIKDNFNNLLLTNHGERLGLFDFGANIRPLLFDLGKADFDAIAISRINKAISKYMPFIEPLTFETFEEGLNEQDLATVGVRITYNIPSLNVNNQGIEIILQAGG